MGTDYGKIPTIGKDYKDFMETVTEQELINRGYVWKHSEFKESWDDWDDESAWDWSWDAAPPWNPNVPPEIPDVPPYTPGGIPPLPGGEAFVYSCKWNGKTSSIGYTTLTPNLGSTQILYVENQFHIGSTYKWKFVGTGNGSVSPKSGKQVTYTSSSNRTDCGTEYNDTIILSVGVETCDTVVFSPTLNSANIAYGSCTTIDATPPTYLIHYVKFGCANQSLGESDYDGGVCSDYGWSHSGIIVNRRSVGAPNDCTHGCCPTGCPGCGAWDSPC